MSFVKNCALPHPSPISGDNSTVKVVFDGSTILWKTATRLDVLLVLHSACDCLEVIAFSAEHGVEAPRLYLNAVLLLTRFANSREHIEKVAKLKELTTRRRRDFAIIEEVERDFFFDYATNYVLTRLAIGCNEFDNFTVHLERKLSDYQSSSLDDVVIEKPVGLEHYRTRNFVAKYRASIFAQGIDEVRNTVRDCQYDISAAAALNKAAMAFMDCPSIRNSRCALHLNQARLRWAKAINQVIHRNMCAKFRESTQANLRCTKSAEEDKKDVTTPRKLHILKKPSELTRTMTAETTASEYSLPSITTPTGNESVHVVKKSRPVSAPSNHTTDSSDTIPSRGLPKVSNQHGIEAYHNAKIIQQQEKSKRDYDKLPPLSMHSNTAVGNLLDTFKRIVAFH